MPISPTASYRLIYAQAPFASYTAFLQGLRTRFPTVEIPFLDALDLPDEARDAVDSYLYVLNDGEASKVVAAVKQAASRGRAFPARMDELGVVPGRDVAEMLERFKEEQEGETEVGEWSRIQSGAHRNLIVRMTAESPRDFPAPDGVPWPNSAVVVEYFMFGKFHPMVVAQTNLVQTRAPVSPESAFTNYLAVARQRKAVILDADTELREACCRVDNLYTRPDPEAVAAAIARGDEPPRWGRYVGGCQAFYFTISRYRMFFPEFELHVVFDERPGGPRAGKGSPSFEEAYRQNRDWVRRYVAASGLYVYSLPNTRSEDVIGSLTKRMTDELGYAEVVIATKGTDLYPLVSDRVRLSLPKINFRDHPQTIRVPDALERFGMQAEEQLNRIYWLRAITGDVGGTPSVNQFNKDSGHRYVSIRREDYLPHVLTARDLPDLKLRLLVFEAFQPFITGGQFDRNLADISLRTDLLDDVDMADFQQRDEAGLGLVDHAKLRALLEENAFHKEVEYLEWQTRITRGLW